MKPVDELFPNSEGVYRQDVEANLQDEEISGITMKENYDVKSSYERKQEEKSQDSSSKKRGKNNSRTKYASDLTTTDQDFIPNLKAVREMFVDGQGIEK